MVKRLWKRPRPSHRCFQPRQWGGRQFRTSVFRNASHAGDVRADCGLAAEEPFGRRGQIAVCSIVAPNADDQPSLFGKRAGLKAMATGLEETQRRSLFRYARRSCSSARHPKGSFSVEMSAARNPHRPLVASLRQSKCPTPCIAWPQNRLQRQPTQLRPPVRALACAFGRNMTFTVLRTG
jgi:hypothetical protein